MQIILIDDDKLIHLSWKYAAGKKEIDLISFQSINEFLERASDFSREISIYIDSHLGDDEPAGEIQAKRIADLGFKNLYLASGFNEKDIELPDYFKGFSAKRFPL